MLVHDHISACSIDLFAMKCIFGDQGFYYPARRAAQKYGAGNRHSHQNHAGPGRAADSGKMSRAGDRNALLHS